MISKNKSRKKKNKVSFNTIDTSDSSILQSENQDAARALEYKLRIMQTRESQNREMQKSVQPVVKARGVTKSKIAFSSRQYDMEANGGAVTKGYTRLDDLQLKNLSQVDPHISAIIATRVTQSSVIGRESVSKFDRGTRVVNLNPVKPEQFENDEQFQRAQLVEERQARAIMDWVLTCGDNSKEVIDAVFAPTYDPLFRRCSFSDFIEAQTRNALTFGRFGTQLHKSEETGSTLLFRPVPIETIQHADPDVNPNISNGDLTTEGSKADIAAFLALPEAERPVGFLQVVDGQNVNFFTEDELKLSYLQKQALFDLNGYPLSPIEQALYMVFIHQNTLTYFKNQFVKGLGTKGMLVLTSEDGSKLSDEDLDLLRREFHNYLTRTDNMSATPVVSGAKVEWINMASTPKDMEFLHTEEHVIRALCSAFQISPQEMGYGHLGLSSPGLNSAGKDEEIIRGEERGLRMLLDSIYDHVNEIVYESWPGIRGKYKLDYTGVGDDTRDTVISRGIQEIQTTATMNSLWADSEKKDSIPSGGDVPLSPTFHSSVVRYMHYGEFMELYFGKDGWSKDSKYDFLIDPALNQAYQEAKMFSDEEREMQGELQLATQAEQVKGMQMQNHAMEAQMGQMQQAEEQAQPEQEPAEKSKSLSEFYDELKKSNNKYLKNIDELLRIK